MATNLINLNPGVRRRIAASFAFGTAALLCQALTWVFITIDNEYWGLAAFSLELAAIPMSMIVAFIWWPREAKGPKASAWEGFSVLLIYLNFMALIGTIMYGPYEDMIALFSTFAYFVAFAVQVLGAPLLLTFCMAGYLLCDENIK